MITDNEDNCSFESMAMVASTPTVSCVSCGYFGVVNEFDHFCMLDCSAKKREEMAEEPEDRVGVQAEQPTDSPDQRNAETRLEESNEPTLDTTFESMVTSAPTTSCVACGYFGLVEFYHYCDHCPGTSYDAGANTLDEPGDPGASLCDDEPPPTIEIHLEERDIPSLTASIEATQKEVEQLKREIHELKARHSRELQDAEQRLEKKEKKLVEDNEALRELRREQDNTDDDGDYFVGLDGKKIYYRDIPPVPVSPSTSSLTSSSDDDQETG